MAEFHLICTIDVLWIIANTRGTISDHKLEKLVSPIVSKNWTDGHTSKNIDKIEVFRPCMLFLMYVSHSTLSFSEHIHSVLSSGIEAGHIFLNICVHFSSSTWKIYFYNTFILYWEFSRNFDMTNENSPGFLSSTFFMITMKSLMISNKICKEYLELLTGSNSYESEILDLSWRTFFI